MTQITQIAVINESTVIADAAIREMIPAFETQWNRDLQSVWRIGAAGFEFVPRKQAPAPGSWWVVFLDNSDQAQSLAYHDVSNEGHPIAKIFVKSLLADNHVVSIGASHEICEMGVNPWFDIAYVDPNGVFWAGEVCDPVEGAQYSYLIDRTPVTDFVTPNWFAPEHAKGDLDLQRHAKTAFTVLDGGYAQKFDPEQAKEGWQQVTGAKALMTSRATHAALGSRRERRTRHRKNWQRSQVRWNA